MAFRSSSILAQASAASVAIPVPSGAAVGDIAVCFIYMESAATITGVPSGFTNKADLATSPTTQGRLVAYWKRLTAADSGTYTFSWTGATFCSGECALFSGRASSGDPFDGTPGTAESVSGVTTLNVSTSPANANGDAVGAWTNFNTGGAWTAPTNYTERQDQGSLTLDTRDAVVSGSTGSVTATQTITDFMKAFLGVLAADAIGGPVVQSAKPGRTWERRFKHRQTLPLPPAAAGASIDADAALTVTAVITAAADRLANVDASLTATAAITADATVANLNADATLTVTASRTATATSTQPVTATRSATATITATASRAQSIDASLTTTASITATASVTRAASASLTATAAITPTATLTAVVTATRTTTATITADAAVGVVAQLTSTATVTATATVTRAATASLTATATRTAAVTLTAATTAALSTTAATTATATVTRAAAAVLTATATIAATATVDSPVAAITPRPNDGITPRPSTGTTARPTSGITIRVASGITVRPFTGITTRP